jgi:hypothetical protein
MLLSSIKLHTLHLAGYLPTRRSAGKFEVKPSLAADFARLLFVDVVAMDNDASSSLAAA